MGKNNKANLYVDCASLHDEVTGSCIYCTVRYPNGQKTRFLVDCGLFQEEIYEKKNPNFPFDAKDIDFLLVTHNHIDHIGRIPLLYKKGFKGRTFASVVTAELMPIALQNTANILDAEVKKTSKRKIACNSSIPLYLANQSLYTMNDVENSMDNVIGVNYGIEEKIDEHITATFYKNGHVLGAACILVKIEYPGESPIHLMFSGDYATSNDFFKVEGIDKETLSLPIHVFEESTYGTTSKSNINYAFRDTVLSAIKNNETLLMLLFSFGRNQEIEYQLKLMQDEKLLPISVPIYSDGNLSHSYDEFYLTHPEYLDIKKFRPKNLRKITTQKERETLVRDKSSKIILTSSGMGNYGPAQFYIPNLINKNNCSIVFGGYCAPGTLGNKLNEVENGDELEINGVTTKKRAKVFTTNEFSSHAKQEDLLSFLEQFTNLKTVLINHGEKDVKDSYLKIVNDRIHPKATELLSSTEYIRIGAYGIIKKYAAVDLIENNNK